MALQSTRYNSVKTKKENTIDSIIAQMDKKRQSSQKVSPLLKDIKLKRNSICPDWPGYFLKCKHTVIINDKN